MAIIYVAVRVHHSVIDSRPDDEEKAKEYYNQFLKDYFRSFDDYGEGVLDWDIMVISDGYYHPV